MIFCVLLALQGMPNFLDQGLDLCPLQEKSGRKVLATGPPEWFNFCLPGNEKETLLSRREEI